MYILYATGIWPQITMSSGYWYDDVAPTLRQVYVFWILIWRRCTNCASGLCLLDIDMTTLHQLCVRFMSSGYWYDDVAPTLRQVCLLDIDMTTLHRLCVRFMKNVRFLLFMVAWKHLHRLISTWHLSGWQGQDYDIKFRPFFPCHTLKFHKITL